MVLTLLMGLIIVPVSLQILSRLTGIVPRYIWTEEIARFCFVWLIMIGSIVAVREATHFKVDLLPSGKTPREKAVLELVVHLCMMVMALFFAGYGVPFARSGYIQNSEMSGLNMLSIYIAFPLAGVSWMLFLVEKIVTDVRRLLGQPSEETP